MALNGLFCADVPLRNYSLTLRTPRIATCKWLKVRLYFVMLSIELQSINALSVVCSKSWERLRNMHGNWQGPQEKLAAMGVAAMITQNSN